MPRCRLALFLLFAFAGSAHAQTTPASTAPPPPQPPLRRWFEFQQFAIGTRYRYIESSADKVTSNHMQYREQIRARINLDSKKRYTINAGMFAGNQFISSWDNLGPGTGDFDGADHYLKQLYVDAAPVKGFDAQFGGLYVIRGEVTEYVSYDDDGFLVGGRASIRLPKTLYLDEISVTHGTLGPSNQPNLWNRWKLLDDTNYTQVLGAKRFSQLVSSSLDYTHYEDTDTVRGAITLHFKPKAAISTLRYEQYVRTSEPDSAAGFNLSAERPITKWVRLQGGYTTVDEDYGGLNADRIQRGRRFWALANVPIWGPLTGTVFATRSLDADYSISNKVRFEAVLTWDVLNSLHKTGVF